MVSLVSCTAWAGVAEWVCCPGRQNAPLYRALVSCPAVHRWAVGDDRTAAYFALGRAQATARPVAVVAGSGTAAASMLPAVAEAYYERRPLVVVTVDSADAMGGTGAPQCMEQENLFGIFAPTVELALPCPVSDLPDLAGRLADGFPLHLHVRLQAEAEPPVGDLSMVQVAEPPAVPPFRGSLVALSQMLRFRAQEGLVLMLGALEPDEQEPVLWLAQTLRVPVLAEASSGLREELTPYLLHDGDEILSQYPPRFVLRVGAVPTGRFWRELETLPQVEVFSITRTGFSGLNRPSTVIEGEPEQIMKALGDVPHVGDTERLLPRARHAAGRLEERLLAAPESAEALVRALSVSCCMHEVICLASPTAVALWNRCAQQQVATLYVRDLQAGGADGQLARFLANAADAEQACCLIGDTTLLRDMNAAALAAQLPPGRRVLAVLNNGGAAQADAECEGDEEMERLLMQPPAAEIAPLAQLWGAEYYAVHSEADLEVLEHAGDDAFIVLELFPED